MENTLEGINRLGDTEEYIHNLEDRIMKTTESEQQKEKQWAFGTISSVLKFAL